LSISKLKKAFFGDAQPSLLRAIITLLVYLTFGLAIYGYMADFIPSESWSTNSLFLSVGVTVTFVSIHYYLLFTGFAKLYGTTSKIATALHLILYPFLVFSFLWVAISHGIADLVTQSVGSNQQVVLELTKGEVTRKKTCTYRLVGESLKNALPDHVCIRKTDYDALPEKGFVALIGQQTSLGFHVERVSPHP
jgi:hypothetical protein